MKHRLFSAMPNSACDSRDHAYQGDCDSPVGAIQACRPSRAFSKPRQVEPRYLESRELDKLWAAYVAAWGTGTSHAALTAYLNTRNETAPNINGGAALDQDDGLFEEGDDEC